MNSYRELYAFLVREIDAALVQLEQNQSDSAKTVLQNALHRAEDAVCSVETFPEQAAE